MSSSEFAKQYLGYKPKQLEPEETENEPVLINSRIDRGSCEDVPDYKNWSAEGKVVEVLDQRQCSCCYLFAALGTIENAVAIEYNLTEPVKLSTQHTLQCMKNMTGGLKTGCDGDTPETIWRYARNQGGIVAESSFKLYDSDPSEECVSGLDKAANSTVEYWGNIASEDEEAMKCFVAKQGALSVTVTTSKTGLPHYSSGIFDDLKGECTSEKPVDHVSFYY